MLRSMVQDARYALRLLVSHRGFTAAALVTLALGIGGSTAIFTVVDAVVLEALPYPDADRLVVLWERAPAGQRNSVSPGTFGDIARYLDEALQLIQANALKTRDVDWAEVRREVFARATTAKTTVAAYPALRHALAALNDNHSFLQLSAELEAAEAKAIGAGAGAAPPPRDVRPPSPFGTRMRPEAEMLGAEETPVALVFMPQGRRDSAFSTSFQQSLATLDARRPCGWIVDLRGNGGGDMWPMLAGLGPLLGDGHVGGSVHASGARDRWIYDRGAAIFEDAAGVRKSVAAVTNPITVAARSIAVLIDRGTASSGEAMALAFRGDPRARLFGETTYGASTATRGFKLSDGANLVIAVSTFTDRSGQAHPHGVTPDVEIPIPDTLPSRSDDAVRQSALAWLRSQASCAANLLAHTGQEGPAVSADDAQALLRAHQTILAAHRTGDVESWMNVEAETVLAGNRGELRSSGAADRRRGREAYLKAMQFSSYRDLREPLVRISDDGTLGWVVAEVEVKGTLQRPDGTARAIDDIWVWVELYEKQAGRWRMVGNVSTDRQR